jgi:hypothetical protein
MGYSDPPPSFLPECDPVHELDQTIVQDLQGIGFLQNFEKDCEVKLFPQIDLLSNYLVTPERTSKVELNAR